MGERKEQVVPLARMDKLIVQELPDELLIYDLERHKAHCLNRASAIVWRHCDGKTTVAEMARLLERELATQVNTDVVWLALGQLRRFHLLEAETKPIEMWKVSRRDLVRKYLPAALALPVILSIPSPTAAQTASKPCAAPNNRPNGCPCAGPADCQSGCCLTIGIGGSPTCQPSNTCD
jgi:hypothetical protein